MDARAETNFTNTSIITQPQPGETVWDKDGATYEQALALANEHWDVDRIAQGEPGIWAVSTRGGYAAMVGKIGGKLAILNKETDGSRTLIALA